MDNAYLDNMAKGQGSVGEDRSDVLRDIPLACADETAAVDLIEQLRWGDEPACPRCGDVKVRRMLDKDGNRNARFLWKCGGCKKQFTVRIGTILEESRIPFRIWCHAFWRACSSKKGVSALQIKRETGLSYKSALFLMHRIRFAMTGDHKEPRKLSGTVEADETYVGGKPRYRQKREPLPRKTPLKSPLKSKAPVFAMVERGGEVRASALPTVNKNNVIPHVRRMADLGNTRLMTDESPIYTKIGPEFPGGHETVNHGRREYVRGDAHTNTIESFFAILKRQIYGTHHAVSKRHLHRYVGEVEFKYNTRRLDDGARMFEAVRSSESKRLRYQEQTKGETLARREAR